MAKKVLISGYIGYSNFGDDVIFAILTRHLKAKGFDITALSSNPKKTKKQFKVNAVNNKNPLEIIKSIFECDYLISGGGSLLQNATSSLSLLYYLLIIIFAKLMFKKVIIFAQGIGPIYGSFWNKLTRFAILLCDFVTVRDSESYKLLGKWKIKSRYVADPAWDIPILPRESRGYVGVQLRSFSNMHPDFIKLLVKYIGIYFSDRRIILFSLQNSHDLQMCYLFEKTLKSQWPQMKYEIRSENTIKSVVEGFSNLDFLFAMRFHACLLGLKYGTKVFALSYDPKVENLAREFELQSIDVSKKPDDYNDKFRKFIQFKEHKEITEKRKTAFDWSAIDKFMLG